jgi:predicted unusual protein kinase regulating ubiquinone biosynthesis (AarF/ABC1/UbiB family)
VQFMLDNFMGKPMESQSISAISDDLFEVAYAQPFRFPATFTFVLRALSTLEGLGKGLDPDFNFMEVAKPFATDLMGNNNGGALGDLFGELGKQAAQAGNTAFNLPRRLEETIVKLERGDIKLRVRSQETDRLLRRISGVGASAVYAVLGIGLTLVATILFVTNWYWLAAIALSLGSICIITTLRMLIRMDRLEKAL